MKVAEIMGTDPLKAQLDSIKRQEKATKVRKARIKAQQAQQQLRTVQSPAKP